MGWGRAYSDVDIDSADVDAFMERLEGLRDGGDEVDVADVTAARKLGADIDNDANDNVVEDGEFNYDDLDEEDFEDDEDDDKAMRPWTMTPKVIMFQWLLLLLGKGGRRSVLRSLLLFINQ